MSQRRHYCFIYNVMEAVCDFGNPSIKFEIICCFLIFRYFKIKKTPLSSHAVFQLWRIVQRGNLAQFGRIKATVNVMKGITKISEPARQLFILSLFVLTDSYYLILKSDFCASAVATQTKGTLSVETIADLILSGKSKKIPEKVLSFTFKDL